MLHSIFSTVNTQHLQRSDVIIQLGYTWRYFSAVKRPSSGQYTILYWPEDGRLTAETCRQVQPSCNKTSGPCMCCVLTVLIYYIYLMIHSGMAPFKKEVLCACV